MEVKGQLYASVALPRVRNRYLLNKGLSRAGLFEEQKIFTLVEVRTPDRPACSSVFQAAVLFLYTYQATWQRKCTNYWYSNRPQQFTSRHLPQDESKHVCIAQAARLNCSLDNRHVHVEWACEMAVCSGDARVNLSPGMSALPNPATRELTSGVTTTVVNLTKIINQPKIWECLCCSVKVYIYCFG
jgi:hypothetical protein